MSLGRCVVVLCLVGVLCVLCASAFAQSPVAAAGHEVALLPEPGASPPPASTTEQPPPTEPAPADGAAAGKPSIRRIEIALLADPSPPPGSVADFVEQALDYKWGRDFASEAQSLVAAASAAPGTPDAARALVMLGETYYRLGRNADGDQAFSQALGQPADGETQALATTAQSIAAALQKGDFGTARDLALTAADSWRGTELGAWALLKAGEIEREYLNHLDAAIPYYEQALALYPGTLAAQEAEVAIAECLGWSWEHPDEAIEAFNQALDHVTNLRLRIQAVLGLADLCNQAGSYGEAFGLYSDFLDQYPAHPSASVVRIYRGYAAAKLGYWELAAEDARAYLDSPAGQGSHGWVHWAHIFLGQSAFAKGDLTSAESEFGAALAAVNHEVHALAHMGVAQCQAGRGDARGAAQSFLEAAAEPALRADQCLRLYQAYRMAELARDASLQRQIMDRMASEFPDSYLTTRLFGHELLVQPGI